jgi:hypothetical protein
MFFMTGLIVTGFIILAVLIVLVYVQLREDIDQLECEPKGSEHQLKLENTLLKMSRDTLFHELEWSRERERTLSTANASLKQALTEELKRNEQPEDCSECHQCIIDYKISSGALSKEMIPVYRCYLSKQELGSDLRPCDKGKRRMNQTDLQNMLDPSKPLTYHGAGGGSSV